MNFKSKNRNFFLFLMLFLFFNLTFVSFVSAAEPQDLAFLGTYKQYNVVTLSQTCDNCSYINLTRVKFPDSSETVYNQAMAQTAPGNFNINFSETVQLGDYIATTCGNPDSSYTCDNYRFKITTTGSDLLTTIPLFLLIAGFSMLALALYYESSILSFSAGSLLSISGVYFLIYGLGVFLNLYTKSLGFTALFIGLIISFASAYEGFTDEE